jgi:hypothetical protein
MSVTPRTQRDLILLGTVVAIGLALVVLGKHNYGPLKNLFTAAPAQIQSGYLLLSIAPEQPEASAPPTTSMVYDFPSHELKDNGFDKLAAAPQGQNVTYQHILSGNGNQVTFLGATNIDATSPLEELPLQVYRANIANMMSYEDTLYALQNAEQVTQSTGVVRETPSISNDGEVLYVEHTPDPSGGLLTSEANSWDIHLVSLQGTDTVLTQGIEPKWVGNDKFVFLKNDGLYAYSLADRTTQKLWASEEAATMLMSLDVSNDFQFVAWTSRDAEQVTILYSQDWSDGSVVVDQILGVEGAFKTVFSPDDRLVAVQTMIATDQESVYLTAIRFFDIASTEEVAESLIFVDVDPVETDLTDWRE